MEESLLKDERRKSDMQMGEPYFWTNTIHGWKHLLTEDSLKDIILSSLQFLFQKKIN